MQFVAIAKIQFLGGVVGLVLAIVIARSGYGYWSLVLRPIANAACIAAGAWLACRWRPGRPVSDAEVRSMVQFGMHVLGFSITNSMMRVADRIALGLAYSPRDVGYYQNAQNMYKNAFLAPIAQLHGVGSAGLSKLRSDPVAVQQKYQATFVRAGVLRHADRGDTVGDWSRPSRDSAGRDLAEQRFALQRYCVAWSSSLKFRRTGCMSLAEGRIAGRIGGLSPLLCGSSRFLGDCPSALKVWR
jgi:hypothetical protein